MNGLVLTLGLVGVAAVLPIWRGAGHTRHDGVSLATLLYESTRGVENGLFGHEHLHIDDAVHRARFAWEDRDGD